MNKLIILLTLVSNLTFGQTNYNTILAPKLDTTNNKINLRIDTKERYETQANLFFAAGVLSTIVFYNLEPKTPLLFIAPVSLCLTGLILKGKSNQYDDE